MKSEIRVRPHSVIPNQQIVEVWYNGEFVATVAGADGPGVRVVSKYGQESTYVPDALSVTEVKLLLPSRQ